MSKPRTLDPEHSTSHMALSAGQRLTPLAYRVDDAAVIVGVSRATLWRIISEGRLPARKLGGSTIIRHDDLAAFVDALPLAREIVETQAQAASSKSPSALAPAMPKPLPPRWRPPTPKVPQVASPPMPTAVNRRGALSPDKILRTPTPELAVIIGSEPIRRPEAMAKLWDYVRAHDLQVEADRRIIRSDPAFQAAFGLEWVRIYDLNKLLKACLSPSWEEQSQ